MSNILIVDLEATCWKNIDYAVPEKRETKPMEIIEIGAIITDFNVYQILGKFQCFILPTLNPDLSEFCQQLTSITQEDVNSAKTFPTVAFDFYEWLELFSISHWGSWGNYDKNQFAKDFDLHELVNFMELWPHVNIKDYVKDKLNIGKKDGVSQVLKRLKMEFEGTPHRAVSDTYNIKKIFEYTHKIHGGIVS